MHGLDDTYKSCMTDTYEVKYRESQGEAPRELFRKAS